MLASDVFVETKALLNDPSGIVFSNTALLPYLNKAFRELQTRMFANQIATVDELTSNVSVSANALTLDNPPADMLYPISLEERLFGSADSFAPMVERAWEPDETPSDSLRYWVWREESIQFIGATTRRDIRLKYAKTLTVISGDNTAIPVGDSLTFLAARTAALAALFIGENPSRSQICQDEAQTAMADFIGTRVRRKQTMPARHYRNRYRR